MRLTLREVGKDNLEEGSLEDAIGRHKPTTRRKNLQQGDFAYWKIFFWSTTNLIDLQVKIKGMVDMGRHLAMGRKKEEGRIK